MIYLYDALLKPMVDLAEFIPEPRPMIGKQNLPPSVQQYTQNLPPIDYQANLYVLEMLGRQQEKMVNMEEGKQGLSLEVVNMTGHNFVANPLPPV